MKPAFRFELKRKLAHIALAAYPLLFLYMGFSRIFDIEFSLAYLLLWLFSEILRVKFRLNTPTAFFIKNVSRHAFKGDLRDSWGKIRFPFWIAGLMVPMLFGNMPMLAASITLSFGDSISGIIKQALNRFDFITGYLPSVTIVALILYLLTGYPQFAVLSPAVGMLAELFGKYADDNLLIPIFATFGSMI